MSHGVNKNHAGYGPLPEEYKPWGEERLVVLMKVKPAGVLTLNDVLS